MSVLPDDVWSNILSKCDQSVLIKQFFRLFVDKTDLSIFLL